MGKEGELWDESALIKAFDDAIAKYKKMHNLSYTDSPKGEAKAGNSYEESRGNPVDGDCEDTRHPDTYESGESNIERGNAEYLPELPLDSSNGVHLEDTVKGHSNLQSVDDYTRLLNEYYVLGKKQQQILQKLQQFGSWNYQCTGESSGFGAQFSTCPSSQHQIANQASQTTVVGGCCPYCSHCMMPPCTLLPACSFGKPNICNLCTHSSMAMSHEKSSPPQDSEIVKTAMGAAERAISAIKMQNSGGQNKEMRKLGEEIEGRMQEEVISETDISDVFNAWYSAGLYTGKYLSVQTAAKKQFGG